MGLPASGISRSQFTRSSHSRPLACVDQLFTTLRARRVAPPPKAAWGAVQAIDSSFLALSATLAPWSQYGRHAAGVRVHTGYDLAGRVPCFLHTTRSDTHDIHAFRDRDWTELRGWTLLMDLGYYSHKTFAALRVADVSWICPLHAQATVEETSAVPGPWLPTVTGDVIISDQVVTLGSVNNRSGAVVPGLRIITSRNAAGTRHCVVTDRHDLPPGEVVVLYRRRWQIELFFRWLKHHLGVIQPLGYSREAIMLTLLLAAIVALLAIGLASARPKHLSDIAWVRMLGQAVMLAILWSG